MLYTIFVSVGLPLVYGSYLTEVDKRKSIKLNLSVFKNAQKNISHHLRSRANKRRSTAKINSRHKKEFKIRAFSKKIVVAKTSFKKMERVTLKTKLLSIKKEKIVKISNDQLVRHYGFKVEENGVNWIAHFKKHKIKEKLATLAKKENKDKQKRIVKKTPAIALAKKIEKTSSVLLNDKTKEKSAKLKKNKSRIDRVKHSLASTRALTNPKKRLSQNSVHLNYPKIGPPLNTHLSISSANKDILSPVVRQAIDRAYNQFDMNTQNKNNHPSLLNTHVNNHASEHPPKKKKKKDIPQNDLTVFVYPKKKEKGAALSSRPSLEIGTMLSPASPTPPFKNSQQNLIKIDMPSNNDSIAKNALSKKENIQMAIRPPTENLNKNTEEGLKDFTMIDGLLTAYPAGKLMSSKIYNLAFIPDYDSNTSFYDHGDGEIEIEEKINGPMSILSGVLHASEMMLTRINWMLTLEDQKMHVPLFNKSRFYDLLKRYNLTDEGGHLLIELNDAVETIDLDSEYNTKLYLDKNFNKNEDDIHFILYIGVSPGNRLVKYKTFNDKISEKVVFLAEGEVFYDKIHLWRPGLEKISLFEKKLMGQYPAELVIDGDQIRYFNKDIKASIAGTNFYEYLRPQLPSGMRQYLRFTHLDGTIFSGHWHKKELEIPSSNLIDEVYRMFDIENLHKRCFIQLNFSKKIMALKSQGITIKGPMDLQMMILEKDGTITPEITGNAEKVFFLGDEQGTVNIKISYVDNSVDIFQTYCSSDSYLVEQL